MQYINYAFGRTITYNLVFRKKRNLKKYRSFVFGPINNPLKLNPYLPLVMIKLLENINILICYIDQDPLKIKRIV